MKITIYIKKEIKTEEQILSWLITHAGVEDEWARKLIYNTLYASDIPIELELPEDEEIKIETDKRYPSYYHYSLKMTDCLEGFTTGSTWLRDNIKEQLMIK